jgi:glutamate 5-kinase
VSTDRDRARLGDVHRIVVKLGTNVVTHDGVELALGRIHALVEDIARLRKAGKEIVLVSSGAIGMGMRVLALSERPRSLGLRQACAAVGQGHLIGLYTQAFAQLAVVAAQVLLTQEDLGDRDRALCLRTTLMRLLELGTVPILNENDSVSIAEIVDVRAPSSAGVAFGDNDGLSARVAVGIDADLLVLLTDVDGLYTANPRVDPQAQRISSCIGIDDETRARASGTSSAGTGGMISKLEAAALVADAGIPAVIASGSVHGVLGRLFAGDDLGTIVWPTSPRSARRGRISRGPRQGALVVNAGAIAALAQRKASLLPIGVLSVEGEFERGDAVEIRDDSGRVLGRGLVNYDAAGCRALAGHHSSEIADILGERGYDALVTRDNLVLVDSRSSGGARGSG